MSKVMEKFIGKVRMETRMGRRIYIGIHAHALAHTHTHGHTQGYTVLKFTKFFHIQAMTILKIFNLSATGSDESGWTLDCSAININSPGPSTTLRRGLRKIDI